MSDNETPPEDQQVLYEVADNVATITLNRPHRRNAITSRMLQQLGEAFLAADNDVDVRAIVLTGAGQGFCSGLDMKEAFAGKQASLTLDDTVAKFCDKVGGAERISKLAGYKYALGVPCLFVGAALTLAVLRVSVLGDYVASQDDVDHRARELAKGAGAHASPATASSAIPANLGAGDAPATPPQDAVSGRVTLQTDEQMERAERFDILGSRRYAQLSAVFGALWKRRENYYAKFAFLSILWVALTTELALECDRDVALCDACETLVKEIFVIQTFDMTKLGSSDISFTLMNANANFFRIALLSGFGVPIFLATFFASENRVLFAELLQGTGPGTAATNQSRSSCPQR